MKTKERRGWRTRQKAWLRSVHCSSYFVSILGRETHWSPSTFTFLMFDYVFESLLLFLVFVGGGGLLLGFQRKTHVPCGLGGFLAFLCCYWMLALASTITWKPSFSALIQPLRHRSLALWLFVDLVITFACCWWFVVGGLAFSGFVLVLWLFCEYYSFLLWDILLCCTFLFTYLCNPTLQ